MMHPDEKPTTSPIKGLTFDQYLAQAKAAKEAYERRIRMREKA